MATLAFTFETTEIGKTRIRQALAIQGGFVGSLSDPAAQSEIDAKAREYFRQWLNGKVAAVEAKYEAKQTVTETEALTLPLPLT